MEAETAVNHNIVEQDSALFRYNGVLRSIWGIVKAANKSTVNRTDTLTYSRLFFEKGRKFKTTLSEIGPFQDRHLSGELKSAFEVRQLGPQTLPCFATGYATLRSKAIRLRNVFETLGPDRT